MPCVVSFTDFGGDGPYMGQMRAAIMMAAPSVAVVDLMCDAPVFNPRASAYLLAALVPYLPTDAVILGVVDPGVGGDRNPVVVEVDGRLFVGPDNGLFEMVRRRGRHARAWRIDWQPDALSVSFHGRDLFAPVAARLALGDAPGDVGCVSLGRLFLPDWPDDLAEIIYLDHYGNAMTGLRAGAVPPAVCLRVLGHEFRPASTFSAVSPGQAFWYVNSCGLIELAVNRGRVDTQCGLTIGAVVTVPG